MKSSKGLGLKVGLPKLGGIGFSIDNRETLTMEFNKTNAQILTRVETYSLDMMVPVPPHTYVNASYVVTEENFETTWESDVYFTGCLLTQLYKWYFEGELVLT